MKGSHAILYYGARKTVVKDRRKELGAGLLSAMIRQLGLTRAEFEYVSGRNKKEK